MSDRLALMEWARNVDLPLVPAPGPPGARLTRQLVRDTRALLMLLASKCDPFTGCVAYEPERWAQLLSVDLSQIRECVEQLCVHDLAFSDSAGNKDNYAVRFPDEVRPQRTIADVSEDFPAKHYAYRRHAIWTPLLRSARAGTLVSDWRKTLSVEKWMYRGERAPEDPRVREADEMIIRELRSMPPVAWEPFVAEGDWRSALEAWYRAAVEVFDSFEVLRLDGRRARDEMDRETSIAVAEGPEVLSGHRCGLRSGTDAFYQQERDEIEARYLAGKAAGGVDVDWLGWFRARVQDWPELSARGVSTPAEVLTRLDDPAVQAAMQMLPDYWRLASADPYRNADTT